MSYTTFEDFGFTAVDEDELEIAVKANEKAAEAEQSALSTQERLDGLYNAILPLLNNLKANPQKDYIYWPNRIEKVEQFEDFIYKIYKE
jgi:hypothetical protein